MSISRILVVIDPTSEHQPALDRAVEAAHLMEASLILFASIYEETDAPTKFLKSQFVQKRISEQRQILDQLAEQIHSTGIEVSIKVDWDKEWYSAVVRASIRYNSDVIFKSTIKHSTAQRVINRTSDWTLLRDSLCPVLLVREGSSWSKNKLLAAVDFDTEDQTRQAINKTIVELGREAAEKYNSEVDFLIAYNDSMADMCNEFADKFGVPVNQLRCEIGMPASAIIETSKKVDPGLIVIGSVARSGAPGLFAGNTAEKILDHVDCDVLAMLY